MRASEWLGRWAGQTVVCIGSGPSLTQDDCHLVRDSGLSTIVTNTTFRMCPWAEVLLAHDAKWWALYKDEVNETFSGRKVTCSATSIPNVHSLKSTMLFHPFGNSGAAAISLAAIGGAKKIVLLGFDCQPAEDGKRHWHDDHPAPLKNAVTIDRWHLKFAKVADYAKRKKAQVVNASRQTALKCFDRLPIEDALRG